MNRVHISFRAVLCKLGKPIFFACAFALLAGCAVEPARPTFYAPPNQQPGALASIIGTRAVSGYIGDQTIYLAAVDGLPIENAKANAAGEVKVAPGYRALTIVCAQESLLATSEITAELKAGQAYTLKAEKIPVDNAAPKNAQGDELYNIWIEDSLTQEVVDAKHMAKLNAIAANIPNPENHVSYSKIGDATGELLIRLIGAVLDAMINGLLEPDNSHSANSVESSPIKQPAATQPVQNPKPGKTLQGNNAPPGKLTKP